MRKYLSLKLIFVSVCLSFIIKLNAQIDTLYSLGTTDNRLTAEERDKLVEEAKLPSANDSIKWMVRFKVTHEKFIKDTLICYGGLHFSDQSLLSESERNRTMLNLPIPYFEFEDINNKRITSDDFKGKVLLLNFWFNRCAPCIAEMPELNKIRADYAAQNIAFIAMAPETKEQIIKFLNSHDFQFRHIADADIFLKQFGVGFPKNILIDKYGIIRYIGGGIVGLNNNKKVESEADFTEINSVTLVEQIDMLLAE